MTITPRRRKLSEEELAGDYNADNDLLENYSISGSQTITVPLSSVRHQISRILEFFIIIQFTIGAFIFFLGIFLLSWAVTPGTAFRAASYMLLAGLMIGRSLLGLVGLHPGRSGALFAYGSLLICTCILRTVMILVCMKILMGSETFKIPPLLSAAPGAQGPIIELICAIVEASQAVCAFYVAWIIDKQSDAERDYNDQQLEVVLINLRAMQQKRNRKHQYSGFEGNRKHNDSFDNDNTTQNYHRLGVSKSVSKQEVGNHTGNQNRTGNGGQTQAEIDYFAIYKRYPRHTTPTPSVPSKSPKPPEQIEPEVEIQPQPRQNEQQPEVQEERQLPVVTGNKRHLPKRPFTLDYGPAEEEENLEEENVQQNRQQNLQNVPYQNSYQQNHPSYHQQLPVQTHHLNQPPVPNHHPNQLPVQNYYVNYNYNARSPYGYYDSVAKTPLQPEVEYEVHSQANSPLLYDRGSYYGATTSGSARVADEFEYRAFNDNYHQ